MMKRISASHAQHSVEGLLDDVGALANAVADAVSVRLRDLPLSCDRANGAMGS